MSHDDEVRRLLSDAVSDVHPEPALGAIRERTSQPRRRIGSSWPVVVAAAAAVAVIVGGITVLNRPSHPSASAPPIISASASATASGSSTADPSASVERTVAAYFVGDTPQGPRLYREFQRVSVPADRAPAFAAVQLALGRPQDPDYRSAWPTGTQVVQESTGPTGDVTVSLDNPGTDLAARPAGMSAAEARAAVQQVVYSAQAAVHNRNPVRIQLAGKDVTSLLGVNVSAPVPQGSPLDVLALVSITDPAEGATVHNTFVARGVASSFEANVPWKITLDGTTVLSGFSTATGWTDRLYPWQSDPINVSTLAPGSYVFAAMTDDPSGGEGAGPMVDTRTIEVR